MYLFYIDDSYERPNYIFSALGMHEENWEAAFKLLKGWRKKLNQTDGIYVRKEFHATDFVSGRGRLTAQGYINKWRRAQIFHSHFELLASADYLSSFNVILNREDWAFERLLNRINRTMQAWDDRAILFCDEGKEAKYTKLVRKMSVHNPIPSQYGVWLDTGKEHRNIPLDRIIEDPIFKDSERSYFIQSADFCAYALLRREVHLRAKNKYRIHKAFEKLEPICVKAANPNDSLGIIR